MRRLILVLAAFVFALAACSSGSGSSGSSDGGSDSGSESASDDETTTTEAEADPCTNALEIVNGEAETATTVSDGEFTAVTMWADKAPHPDNTVDYDDALELGFFTYEQEPDGQFGYSIPIDPDTPDGEHFMSFSLANPNGPVAPGQVYVDALDFPDSDADGEINFSYWEQGSDRLLPGDFEITITELTDDQVCGEITTVTGTELQQFVGIEGTFVADRVQALDAAADDE